MSKFLQADDNNEAKAIAILQVFSENSHAKEPNVGQTIVSLVEYIVGKGNGGHQNFLLNLVVFKPLPHMPILGSFNSAANKDMMSKTLTTGDTIFRLSRKHCGKRRNCSS